MRLITGASGLLGSSIVRSMLQNEMCDEPIMLLLRGKNYSDAESKFLNLKKWVSRKNVGLSRLSYVRGDLSSSGLGLSSKDYNYIIKNVKEIYHCAALTNFLSPLSVLRKENVKASENVFQFALKGVFLDKVCYVSSIFIAGKHEGDFSEKDFDCAQLFNNNYEKSKFEAEKIARRYQKKNKY